MSEELLRIDRLPTLAELRFLLRKVTGKGGTIYWSDLAILCRSHSLNLGLFFENGIKLLTAISLVDISGENGVKGKLSEKEIDNLGPDSKFCSMIAGLLIGKITESGHLTKLFNEDTVKFDFKKDAISININLIPLNYPMIKVFLLNMGIAQPERNIRGRMLINGAYKQLFIEQVLSRVFEGSETLDIVKGEEQITPSSHTTELPAIGVKLFVSYAHEDEHFRNELKKHFSPLVRREVIKLWYDALIHPGEEWDIVIKRKLEEADYIVLIISSDFLDSDYINEIEVQRAIQRHDQSLTRIIPIIARDCDFSSSPLSRFQALPTGAKPITSWRPQDKAYVDIITQFKKFLMR